jgi:regulator of protease activity HflC (stomatin/prohibitin superfamily)
MRDQKWILEEKGMITGDHGRASLTIDIVYAVTDPAKAFFSVQNYKVTILHESVTELRTIVSGMNEADIPSQINSIRSKLERHVKEAAASAGIDVKRVHVHS